MNIVFFLNKINQLIDKNVEFYEKGDCMIKGEKYLNELIKAATIISI